jgi:hypothetical protein
LAAQCAELTRLRAELEQAKARIDGLAAEDLAVRRGHETKETLRDFVDALDRSLAGLEQLCRHECVKPAAPAGDDSAPLKVIYDAALQHQELLAARLNALIGSL